MRIQKFLSNPYFLTRPSEHPNEVTKRKTWEIILLAIWHDPCKGILPNPHILGEKCEKFEKRIFFGKAVSRPFFIAEHPGAPFQISVRGVHGPPLFEEK